MFGAIVSHTHLLNLVIIFAAVIPMTQFGQPVVFCFKCVWFFYHASFLEVARTRG